MAILVSLDMVSHFHSVQIATSFDRKSFRKKLRRDGPYSGNYRIWMLGSYVSTTLSAFALFKHLLRASLSVDHPLCFMAIRTVRGQVICLTKVSAARTANITVCLSLWLMLSLLLISFRRSGMETLLISPLPRSFTQSHLVTDAGLCHRH
jgi:hypothetical protein